jgi:hypothetical protein
MTFCDKETVRRAIEGKTVALVGSGPGVMDNEPGFIDSHDVVIRISNYKLFPETGKRTDIFYSFFGNSILKSAQELQRDGVYLCMCKCPNAKFIESPWHERNGKQNGIDFRYIYRNRANWWFCDTYVPTVEEFLVGYELLGKHIPTTGFAALLDVLSCEPESLYMTGFDFFESRMHNVNEPWRSVNKDDPIGHVPEVERAWFIANHNKYPIQLDRTLQNIVAKGN